MTPIRAQVAKPTTIMKAAPMLLYINGAATLLLIAVTRSVAVGVIFGFTMHGLAVWVTFSEPHINIFISDAGRRVLHRMRFPWPGHMRTSTNNTWPSDNAHFNA